MKKIVILEDLNLSKDQEKEFQKLGAIFYKKSSLQECKDRVKDADVVVIDWIEPNDFLQDMKENSLLALMSTGYGWVDIKKAQKYGIKIANVPGYATEAVAEFMMGLILNLTRKINKASRQLIKRNWDQKNLISMELSGKTMGIVGFGQIGLRLAELARIFDMEILAYDIKKIISKNIKQMELNDLLKQSDIVAVTCAVNDRTRDLLNKEKLNLLKKETLLVASTWEIVDFKALSKKLLKKEIGGFGADVAYEGQKPE